MMEWKKVKLESVLAVPARNGLTKPSAIRGTGVPMIAMGELFANPIINDVKTDLVPVSDKELSSSCLIPGDILFARQSLTLEGAGQCSIVKHCMPNTVFESHLIRIRVDQNKAIPDFIYYYFKSYKGKGAIANIVNQVAAAGIRGSELIKLDIDIPTNIADQRRIAAILSSLDAQIENNNRINRNLEAQAQALFKSWFVDFEPWGGAMPEDWREGKLGEICTFKRGKNLLSKDAINEGVPVVAGGMEPSCYHNMANTGAPVITISGSGANAGFMRMYHVPVWASDCSFIDNNCPNFYFVYCFLACNERLLRHAQTGAVQPHVKPSDIHDFDIIIPLTEIIREFQNKVQPLFLQVGNNTEANARLASLRDTLLPKLMKGEIEV